MQLTNPVIGSIGLQTVNGSGEVRPLAQVRYECATERVERNGRTEHKNGTLLSGPWSPYLEIADCTAEIASFRGGNAEFEGYILRFATEVTEKKTGQ